MAAAIRRSLDIIIVYAIRVYFIIFASLRYENDGQFLIVILDMIYFFFSHDSSMVRKR